MIYFRQINLSNVRQACYLKLKPGQDRFILRNAISIAESQFLPSAKIKSIYNDDVMVGFLMYKQTDAVTISRFMIADEHQCKGYGTAAIKIFLEEHDSLNKFVELANLDNNPSVNFWTKQNFQKTDIIIGPNVLYRHRTNC